MTAKSKQLTYLVTFSPTWDDVESLRVSISLLAQTVFRSAQAADAISMVASELLENAIKYSSTPAPQVTLALTHQDSQLQLLVQNPFTNETPHVTRLRSTLDWLNSFPTAQEAYARRMQTLVEQGLCEEGGLGLARVACEGHCQLSCQIDSANSQVEVLAKFLDFRV